MNDYERIARVIRYLDERHTEQPDLGTLAKCAGMSQFHFHRLFSAWAGITPKDFLQCLSLSHVKQLLRNGESVLGAALEAGLSGPGRAHDLCVTLEAASPGELKAGGEGWTIKFGFTETPFGTALIAEGPRGICHLSFPDNGARTFLSANRSEAPAELQKEWPKAKLQRDNATAKLLADRIFAQPSNGSSKFKVGLSLKAFVKGTAFQVRVWRALLAVESGHVVSYGSLANAIGQPSASRAVGSAVGRNSLAYLIPCHRVIRETGVIGEYRWGNVRKRAMLAWEAVEK